MFNKPLSSFFIVVILFDFITSKTQADEGLDTLLGFNGTDTLIINKVEETPSHVFLKARPTNQLTYGWNKKKRLLFGGFAALQLADVVTTKIAINQADEELNPLFGRSPNFEILDSYHNWGKIRCDCGNLVCDGSGSA